MVLLEQITLGSSIVYTGQPFTLGSSTVYTGQPYKVLGKASYTTKKEPDSVYCKILLEGHHVLVIALPNIIYWGINKGRLSEFDSLDSHIQYDGNQYQRVNHDYQVRHLLEFGSPDEVEGDVEFWDYEVGHSIISVAEINNSKERSDVVAEYISFGDIEVTDSFQTIL